MSLFLNTNVGALNSQRQLYSTNSLLSKSYERLSSGYRINRAADDAAGLQISDRMTSQLQGLNQGIRNANDGVSLSQVAEGAMQEITTSLQRIRQLAIQSQNGINSSSDRAALQKEVDALKTEISRIGQTTQFAGVNLLDGGYSASFLVGANAGQTISVNMSRNGGYGASGLNIGSVDITSTDGASAALTSIDAALNTINDKRADLGALENRFQSTIRNLGNVVENVSSARSRIRDVDFAEETSKMAQMQIMQQANIAMLSQANQKPQMILSLLG